MKPPERPPGLVWPTFGDYPLPSTEEALQASLRAFPSWFLHIVCDRCSKGRMLNEGGQRRVRVRRIVLRA